jgi:hypothetical protein
MLSDVPLSPLVALCWDSVYECFCGSVPILLLRPFRLVYGLSDFLDSCISMFVYLASVVWHDYGYEPCSRNFVIVLTRL